MMIIMPPQGLDYGSDSRFQTAAVSPEGLPTAVLVNHGALPSDHSATGDIPGFDKALPHTGGIRHRHAAGTHQQEKDSTELQVEWVPHGMLVIVPATPR